MVNAKTVLLIGLAIGAVIWLRDDSSPAPKPRQAAPQKLAETVPPAPVTPPVSTGVARPAGWYAEDSTPPRTAAPQPAASSLAKPQRPPLTRATDGNSVFSQNLLASMTQAEYAAYVRHFVETMEEGEAGATYEWTTQRAIGNIIPGEPFLTSANNYCRSFSESYTVGEEAQLLSGVACRSKKGSWCKLRKGSTYNCALLKPGGIEGMMLDTGTALQNMDVGWQRTKNNFNSLRF